MAFPRRAALGLVAAGIAAGAGLIAVGVSSAGARHAPVTGGGTHSAHGASPLAGAAHGSAGPLNLALPPTPSPAATSLLGSRPATIGALSARSAALPVRVAIPRLGVDAVVAPAGVAPNGELAVAHDVVHVAWWQSGALPGDVGTALLAAHVDLDGRLGVFHGLPALRPGDSIVVTAADGHTRAFRVTGSQLVVKTSLSVANLTRDTGRPRLVLVTCGGQVDYTRHSYLSNVIVEAVPA